jgi:hypothetical protein
MAIHRINQASKQAFFSIALASWAIDVTDADRAFHECSKNTKK